MNSYFDNILERHGLIKHDKRPLWKYGLSDDEYSVLKSHLASIEKSAIDPKDLTLLYAEWWKNEYAGGSPSKKKVYDSVEGCSINEDDFYMLAKQGAVMLGVKWIQRGKRLFFRTLLLQGGVPVNHMINNSGQYTNFLKKVMELNPDSIDEFAYDSDITKLLPTSSRNEDVYESCLQIVRAIWNGNEEYISILDNRQQNAKNSIANQLKEHKNNIEKTLKRRANVKAYWVLSEVKNGTSFIQLKFSLPQVIESEGLAQILGLNDVSNLQSEYQLIVDDILLAKFKKNVAGNYKVFLYNNAAINWDGEQLNPDIRIRNTLGKSYQLPILSANAPDFNEPTLWVEKSDLEWILVKGQSCKQDVAFVLSDSNWQTDKSVETRNIKIYDREMRIVKFSDSISLTSNNDDSIVFITKVKSFQWIVNENKPGWLQKSNMPVINGNAQIYVYNEDGNKINNAQLSWRLTGSKVWQSWVANMPIGSIEYKVNVDGLEEKGYFYNIGDFKLELGELLPDQAEVVIINPRNFMLHIIEDNNLDIDVKDNLVKISLKAYNRMPKSIKATIKKAGQVRALFFEIAQPFSGVKIIDPEGNIFTDEDVLLLGNFNGYRIFSPIQNNYYVRLHNQGSPNIKVIKKIPGGTSPLREYDDEVYKLIRLSDSMEKNTAIIIEFFEMAGNKEIILGTYVVKAFNKQLEYTFVRNRVIINVKEGVNANLSLYAIPLECGPGNIELIPLEKEEQGYVFPDIFLLPEKFIVISELNNNTDVLKPAFVSTNVKHEPTTMLDKTERIKKEKQKLIESFNYWEKILKYFEICVQLEMPFTTFDVFRAAANSPELAARMFCYLCVNAYSDTLVDVDIKNLEEDLGFKFHWLSKNDWDNAIEWLNNGLEENNYDNQTVKEILELVRNEIYKVIKINDPCDVFEKIAEYVVKRKIPQSPFDVLNQVVQGLRAELGEKVLNELPSNSPRLSEEYKGIIPVDGSNHVVKVLLKTPVAVALAMAGKDNGLWCQNDNSDEIRRNIQFVQWLTPKWYGLAILHSLNRIHNL